VNERHIGDDQRQKTLGGAGAESLQESSSEMTLVRVAGFGRPYGRAHEHDGGDQEDRSSKVQECTGEKAGGLQTTRDEKKTDRPTTRARGRKTKLPNPVNKDGQVRRRTTWSGVIPSTMVHDSAGSDIIDDSR
jgi:hypothetical protein